MRTIIVQRKKKIYLDFYLLKTRLSWKYYHTSAGPQSNLYYILAVYESYIQGRDHRATTVRLLTAIYGIALYLNTITIPWAGCLTLVSDGARVIAINVARSRPGGGLPFANIADVIYVATDRLYIEGGRVYPSYADHHAPTALN